MLAYCDYIAHVISRSFLNPNIESMIESVEPTRLDLHPTGGYMVSTKKTIAMVDKFGKRYKITIEEE